MADQDDKQVVITSMHKRDLIVYKDGSGIAIQENDSEVYIQKGEIDDLIEALKELQRR